MRGEDVALVVTVALAQVLGDHEDDRQDRRQTEAQVGALLRDELAQLPAVGGERRGAPGRARVGAGVHGGGCGDAAHRVRALSRGGAGVAGPAHSRRRGGAAADREGAGAGVELGRDLAVSIPVLLGEPEEEVLERRQLGGQREDADARRAEREREGAHVALLRLEGAGRARRSPRARRRAGRAASASARASSVVRSR